MTSSEQRYGQRTGALQILILGGSQGAVALNELLPQALALLPANERPIIRHQTGKKQVELTQQRYRDLGLTADVQPFIADMAEAYGGFFFGRRSSLMSGNWLALNTLSMSWYTCAA